jgi:hypothetical protein
MSAMQDYTPYQERIIKRYYQNQQGIAFQKIEEMMADIYLADTDKKKNAIWKRIEKAMVNLKVPAPIMENILARRSPEILAQNLKDWWQKMPKKPPEVRPER